MATLSNDEIDRLIRKGWDFVPSGPDEWEWIKFQDGKAVARAGDEEWARDLRAVSINEKE